MFVAAVGVPIGNVDTTKSQVGFNGGCVVPPGLNC